MARKLQTKDLFKFARILNNGHIKEELANIYSEELTDKQAGIKVILAIIGACADEKQESLIYDFIGDIVDKSSDEIASESLEELKADLLDISKENNLVDFFKQAQELM